jgi:hypothetical protein
MSLAELSFRAAVADVRHLMEFHEEAGGTGPGKREYRLQSLNKSALVLLCAGWESYVEDVIREAAMDRVSAAQKPGELPVALQQLIVRSIEQDKHDLAMLSLAGEGWQECAERAVESVVTAFNTPKTQRVSSLFRTALGLNDIEKAWTWHKNTEGQPAKKLDEFVGLRGAIAHGGVTGGAVLKIHVTNSLDLIERVIAKTEERLRKDRLIK